MATTKVDVICMGEVLLEFVATKNQKNLALEHVNTFTVAPGGAPANVSVGIQRLGRWNSGFVGQIGKDAFGARLKATLQKEGVDTTFLLESKGGNSAGTSLIFTSVWDDGHKDVCFYRGADQQIQPSVVSANMFENVKCFHFGSITLLDDSAASAQRKMIEFACRHKTDIMRTYDPNYRSILCSDKERAHSVIFEGFKYAHLAKISEEEWAVATGKEDLESGIRAVLDQGVELLIISRGDKGAMATNGHFLIESLGIAPVDVVHNHGGYDSTGVVKSSIVDTTGAGDGFMAAMITALLPEFQKLGGSLRAIDKDIVQQALDYANVVGYLSCTKLGAIPALPTAQEVESFLAQSQEKRDPCSLRETKSLIPKSPSELAKMIDHTYLKATCSEDGSEIRKLCQEAREYGFAMVAVNGAQIGTCVDLLKGTDVRVGVAIGFPLGQTTATVKAFEAEDSIQRGAQEIDMVLNVHELKMKHYDVVRTEIQTVGQICRRAHVIFKVILETCYLTDEEKRMACQICQETNAVDFVKTSTGFGTAGATVQDIELMRQVVGWDEMGVKASGGIRDWPSTKAMLQAGANRIGTSNGPTIIQQFKLEINQK